MLADRSPRPSKPARTATAICTFHLPLIVSGLNGKVAICEMEGDLEEGELPEVRIPEEKPAESSAVPIAKQSDFDKPIPKKAGHDESSDDEPSGSSRLMSPGRLDDSESALLKVLETDARYDLSSFLKRKGVSDGVIGQYTVHVNFVKTKLKYLKDDKKRPTNIYYVAPDGSMLKSKNDAYSDALKYMRDSDDFSSQREKVHEGARLTLSKKQLPFVLNGVKVISFGQIDVRSGFHSPVQLWPVGYRCEQTVEGLTVNGLRTQEVICQIGVSEDGLPQFHIFVPNTESTFIASSEVNVWRKVNSHSCCNVIYFPTNSPSCFFSSIPKTWIQAGVHRSSISVLNCY